MKNKHLIIRGIQVGKKELEDIQSLVQKHWQQGRTAISKEICRYWDWRQPNGWLKDRACRDLLLVLEKKGLINLPASKKKKASRLKKDLNSRDT